MATPGDTVDTPMANTREMVANEDTEMGGVETTEKLKPELYDAMQQLLDTIYAYRDEDGHDPSKPFHKRPNKRNFPDYYETIQEPVAMSSLKTKINSQDYTEFSDFVRDLALLWHNALVYNRPDAQAYVDATTIRGVMEAELKKIVEAGHVTEEEIVWPDLGEIPAADAEDDGDDDAESGQEGEEDEEEGENSDAEATKPRRRTRRPSTLKRGESQADTAANTRRGRPPKVDTPLEARIKSVLKAIRKPKSDTNSPLIYHFDRLPDKSFNLEYYIAIRNPMALDGIKKSLKRKRYTTFDECLADLDLMFENAKAYNEDNSEVFKAAVQLQALAHKTAEEEKAKPDEDYAFEEGRKPKPGGIQHNGKLWKVGDWVLIRNPNDVTKPIVAQIYRTWEDAEGRDWVNACWYYRPEQTIHHFEKHFWPNEVLKTSQYRDHPIEDVLDRCFVMFFTRFTRGRPRGLDAGTEVFVCEARYNEEKHKINKIKTWSSCLPDEVRDKDYEMDLYESQRRIKKLPSPLEHKTAEAKDDGALPEPRMGADDAPPIEGGVYKGPRDDHQSPPPSPTPSPPPPPPVQPVRQISQTPGRETPIRPSRGNEVDSAMATAARAFGANAANQSQNNFIQQRQHQASASPAPQQQYQQYNQGSGAQGNYGSQYAGPGTPTSQRVNYSSYRSDQSQQRPAGSGASVNQRPSDVFTLPPAANAAIPPEVREKLQTNDQGEILFFPQPPQARFPDDSMQLTTSLKFRIRRMKERLEAKVAAETAQAEQESQDALKINGEFQVNGESNKRKSENQAQSAVKKTRVDEKPLWITDPIEAERIDLMNPEISFTRIDPARVNPTVNSNCLRAFGMGYKDFLEMQYVRHKELWASLVPQDQLAGVLEQSLQNSTANVETSLKAAAKQKENAAKEKMKRDIDIYEQWKARQNEPHNRVLSRKPDFYLEDRDPLYCGLNWNGPNPYPYTGGSTVSKKD